MTYNDFTEDSGVQVGDVAATYITATISPKTVAYRSATSPPPTSPQRLHRRQWRTGRRRRRHLHHRGDAQVDGVERAAGIDDIHTSLGQ
ncbi:hypothetical protein, partial [Pseudomonas sp. GOM6]|uniref:hypothetical protein n=1 Tax=Pseudomonas sp. GOM6 TaxID=3036944 RepID=UPI00240A7EB5